MALITRCRVRTVRKEPQLAKQRSTFGKLERQRAQQAVAKAKHERRTSRSAAGADERPVTTTDPAEEAAILDRFAKLHASFDDGQISLDEFELRRNELRERLQT